MKIEKKRGKDTFICIFMLEYGNRKYGEKHQRKEGNKWIGKKIRRAICGAAAAVAVCFTAAGMNTKPVYAADMGAVYGIFEHGVGWSAYHGDQTAERAGNGTYVTADPGESFGTAGGNERNTFLSGKFKRFRLAFLAGKYGGDRNDRDGDAARGDPDGAHRAVKRSL